MSMRSGFSFSIEALDLRPIDEKHVWAMLDATSYRSDIAALIEPENDQACWVYKPHCNVVDGRFEEVHPEEFEQAFRYLTTTYPDRTFYIRTTIDEKTEMVEPGETEWLEKNGKTCPLDFTFKVNEMRLMPTILSFALANIDEYHQQLLDQGIPYTYEQIESAVKHLRVCFDKTKDVF